MSLSKGWLLLVKISNISIKISILIAITLLSINTYAYTNSPVDTLVVTRIADTWINIGREQYKRHLYSQAGNSFNSAYDYSPYLEPKEQQKLYELIKKTNHAAAARNEVREH